MLLAEVTITAQSSEVHTIQCIVWTGYKQYHKSILYTPTKDKPQNTVK